MKRALLLALVVPGGLLLLLGVALASLGVVVLLPWLRRHAAPQTVRQGSSESGLGSTPGASGQPTATTRPPAQWYDDSQRRGIPIRVNGQREVMRVH